MARYLFSGTASDFAVDLTSADGTLKVRPGAPLTVWDSEDDGTQLTDLQTVGGEAVTELAADSTGRVPRFRGPDGVASVWIDSGIGSRYQFTTTDVPSILLGKQDRTAPPAPHIHSPADVPGILRGVGQALGYVIFDSTANTWPARPVTSGPVVWIGDAERPAADKAVWGLDYVDQLAVTTNIPDPTPTPEEGVPNADDVILTAPIRSGAGEIVTLDADLTALSGHTFTFLQIAVRGPGGQVADVAHTNGIVLGDGGGTHLVGTFTASAAGSWRAYVAYNLTGGSSPSDWVDGPVTTFTVTLPTPGSNTFPQAGRSGLDWNSGMFPSDAQGAQWEQASVAAAGTYRGNLSDTMLVFAQRNTGWGPSPFGLLSWYDGWSSFPGILILSMPPQPQGQDNAATAAGTNNSRWRDFGSLMASKGQNLDTRVIRLGWECNGNWYDWSWHKAGGPQAYIAAYKNVVTSVRETAPNVKFNLCLNKDWTHPSMTWQAVLTELIDYFDVVGIDAYDGWDGWRNDTGRRDAWYAKAGPQRNNVASWCRSNGKLMSLDEWALVALSGGDGTGGGDDTLYITDTWSWCVANQDVLAWESYYNHIGAPSSLAHTLTAYPSAETAYKHATRWGQ